MKDFLRQFFGSNADEDLVTPVDTSKAVRKSITVSGKVQGVGFRYFVRQEARALGITGWVMNLKDGTVTMEVQSTPQVIEELTERLKKGNGFSKVVQLKSYDLQIVEGENKFGIKY
ncbi:MAG: acylphosphatase [Selenomonadaceae bacterium]|nr:acylphosphatase [Selenomonadaceae bacterium]